jgi:hypothetical protein
MGHQECAAEYTTGRAMKRQIERKLALTAQVLVLTEPVLHDGHSASAIAGGPALGQDVLKGASAIVRQKQLAIPAIICRLPPHSLGFSRS